MTGRIVSLLTHFQDDSTFELQQAMETDSDALVLSLTCDGSCRGTTPMQPSF